MKLKNLQISTGAIVQLVVGAVALSLLLAACGGGGKNAGDTYPSTPVTLPGFTGPNSFLLFPNSIKQADGSYQINTQAYAQAYYKAIDPNNDRDTYDKWLAANQFGSASGTQVTVTVGDKRDLGYGRYITARKNDDGTIAVSVRNFLVPPAAGYGYSTMNLDAAVARDDRWYIGSSNIEFSPAQSGVVGFAKFYFFAPNGSRALMVNLDGRGAKAMPGPCISCHGGRGDPLTPPDANGVQLFPLVQNSASVARGDVQGHFHPLESDGFDYSSKTGFTRDDQEATIKLINTWILSSYPLPFGTVASSVSAEDAGRRIANRFEWQGTAASLIKNGYGGDGLPNARYEDTVPDGWSSAGQESLYKNSFVPACRVCHILRGMGNSADPIYGHGSDIDMTSFAQFDGYSDQIKAHLIDTGNMPLAKILYEKFWSTSAEVDAMATYLEGAGFTVRDSAGAVLKPGRPVAVAGPSRIVAGTTTLSGAASLFATSYNWSFVSGVQAIGASGVGASGVAATLTNETTATPTFTPAGDDKFVVQLVVSKDGVQSEPSRMTIVVKSSLTPVPSAINFTNDIKPILQKHDPAAGAGLTNCSFQCHMRDPLSGLSIAPVAYNSFDRNGDGVADTTDDDWLYSDIKARINFDDIADSSLLQKPSGHHHGGSIAEGFGDVVNKKAAEQLEPGDPLRANYDIFLNWILNGAPK